MDSRLFDRTSSGVFPIGVWHRSVTETRFAWETVQSGQKLGPFEWTIEAYEAAILCYQIEIKDTRFLPTRGKADVMVHPFVASRASYSLFQAHYVPWEGAFLDYEHVIFWNRPLISGSEVVLAGEITRKYEKRDRLYLEWSTECRDHDLNLLFKVTQTVVSPRLRGEESRSGADTSPTAAKQELSPRVLEEIDTRELYCYLGWSRRNSYPPHPNLHTDFEQAKTAGLPGIIMQGAVLGAQIVQAAVDHFGDRFCYGSTVSFKLVRPIMTESRPMLRVYRNKIDNSLNLQLEDGNGQTLVAGFAARNSE